MVPSILQTWQPFFTAQLGASAALAGLLFVGFAFNGTRLAGQSVRALRALVALMLVFLVFVVSSIALLPGQSPSAVAMEMCLVALVGWATMTAMYAYLFRETDLRRRGRYAVNMVVLQFAMLPFGVGSLMLLFGNPAGLYAIAIGVVVALVKAVVDAWALVLEGHR